MVFSSSAFLFFFLPITLLLYYACKINRTLSNAVLTVMSLMFYAWGEPRFVLVMLGSIVLNWLIALSIGKSRSPSRKKLYLALGITLNVLILGVFKYAGFVIRNINALGAHIADPGIALPIGISFFTFQAMSYIIDVYRGKGCAQKSLMNVCLYISFFPQLIAGPIVRYETVALELTGRRETLDDFTEGVRRFIIGLAKKAVLANTLAELVDKIYALENASALAAWIAACAYLMQVYYDFSGYSDMAIGLGRMFGFHFPENFVLPFISKSVTEFWRRWHISMCTWFRDYVFFPLGGSRVRTKARLIFNMLVVWALTGLWHGADWTYVCWGLAFFAVLVFEKLTGFGKWAEKHAFGHFYAMLAVVVITVLIRSSDISFAFRFYVSMLGLGGAGLSDGLTLLLLKEYAWCLALGVVCSLPAGEFLKRRLKIPDAAWQLACGIAVVACGVLAVSYAASGGYNPFIYYNF
ncbi:MAG: MBOAT family protein [Clostridiales bacterium]|nr:MBOAT family protein [Clostridiales bacterium]